MGEKISSNAKKMLLLMNSGDIKFNNGVCMLSKGYPVMPGYAPDVYYKSYHLFNKLEKLFGDKKKVMKYISIFEQTTDKSDFERFIESKRYERLITLLGYQKIITLIKKIADLKISFHNFISNLPNIYLDSDPDSIFNFLMKILDYSETNMLDVLNYMNFKNVLHAKNYATMAKHIELVKCSRGGIGGSKTFEGHLVLNDILIDNDSFAFSKDRNIIYTIGSETNCCFRKGGVAQSLLKPALKSPISGIFHGNFNKIRWFSFIWEIVEFNKDSNLFEINLVLDNVEARRVLTKEDFNNMMDSLRELGYKRIYCGYNRNDLPNFNESILSTIKEKPYSLISYEKEFESYGVYDDSKSLYTLINNKEDVDVVLTRMNKGDLHRSAYIEKLIWGSNSDNDYKSIDVSKSPSYIIKSKTNIYGYLTTRIKYFKESDTAYEQGSDLTSSEKNEVKKNNIDNNRDKLSGIKKVLYIEDIFFLKYKSCILSIKDIINDIVNWCKDNGVSIISGNSNDNSRPFIKRIKEFEGIEYYDQKDISSFRPVLSCTTNRNINLNLIKKI